MALTDLFNLHTGEEDRQKVLENVKANISFNGPNVWILACAIIVASVGLNINSTAVIIGAMLISPLMGPIVGAGFALAIFDFSLLKKSLNNLLIATVVSLTVATLYFFLSPFKQTQSEILARTSPNIYDVLIAFFGGLVGVIAITRVEKGNPIPGVAISTALMPPLCTAGYGLATSHTSFFFGALYLYCINCVFICIATFVIVKSLNYPQVSRLDKKQEKQIHYLVYTLLLLMILPSIYFAYTLLQEQKFRNNADIFIEREFVDKGNILIYKKLDYSPDSSEIKLAFLKKQFTLTEANELTKKLAVYHLNKTKILFKDTGNNLDKLKNDILNEVSKQERQLAVMETSVKNSTTDNNVFDNRQIFNEANALFPSIQSIAVSTQTFASKDTLIDRSVVLYETKIDLTKKEKILFANWLKEKLKASNLEIINKK